MELDVLYEDDVLIAVDKPAGVVVHPTYKHPSGTLLDQLRSRTGRDPQIVGRLDKETSGIVIAATDRTRHAQLQRTPFEKDYLALVDGTVGEGHGTIALPLCVDPLDRRRVIVDPGGAQAETQFERLASAGNATLLRCRLLTGRRHQIRVHLAARGWPIVGDRVYGGADDRAPRHALHACRTAFLHPVHGGWTEIVAPVPNDFALMLHAHGLVVDADGQ